jgi:hypothetical protein
LSQPNGALGFFFSFLLFYFLIFFCSPYCVYLALWFTQTQADVQ